MYLNSWLLLWLNKEMFRYFNISLNESCFFVTRDFNNKGDQIPKSISGIKFSVLESTLMEKMHFGCGFWRENSENL